MERPSIDFALDVKMPEIAPIKHNLNEVKESVLELNKFYNSLLFTEDQVGEAEKELTRLRAFLKTIEDNRKDNVKLFKRPIDDFEMTSKDIEKSIKESISIIQSKIEGFKEKEKEEKIGHIKEIIEEVYNSFIQENATYINKINTSDIVFNDKWLNKTFKESQMKEEIAEQLINKRTFIINYEKDETTIMEYLEMTNNEKLLLNKDKYLTAYKYTLDLQSVLAKIKEDNQVVEEPIIDPFEAAMKSTMVHRTFTGTAEQIKQLEAFAYSIGITDIR